MVLQFSTQIGSLKQGNGAISNPTFWYFSIRMTHSLLLKRPENQGQEWKYSFINEEMATRNWIFNAWKLTTICWKTLKKPLKSNKNSPTTTKKSPWLGGNRNVTLVDNFQKIPVSFKKLWNVQISVKCLMNPSLGQAGLEQGKCAQHISEDGKRVTSITLY